MAWDPTTVTVVVNPAAQGGRIGRRWATLQPALVGHLGPVTFVHTTAAGHARTLAREAARAGARVVVSLGGDGTHGEVAAGLVEADVGAALGILHAGTGGDFRRLLKYSETLLSSAAALPTAVATVVDLGEVACTADDGSAHRRLFINLASAGMSGLVDRLVNAGKKRLGGKLSFLWCTLKAFLKYTPARIRVVVDGEDKGEQPAFMLVVANGRYAGGGMCFAPTAQLDDGQFDVLVLPGMSIWKALRVMPSLYRGRHLEKLGLALWRGRVVEAFSSDLAYMDVDGEAPGRLPATFTLRAAALPLLGVDTERLRG